MTLLIQKGLVYTGENNDPIRTDILIRDNRIIQIKKDIQSLTAKKIKARNSLVIPGLIDCDGAIESKYFPDKDQLKSFYHSRAITTVLLGANGISDTPVTGHAGILLEDIKMLGTVHATWLSLKEMASALTKIKLPVNTATFIGYRTIRATLTGSIKKPITGRELEIIQILTEKNLDAGALGVSLDIARLEEDRISPEEVKGIIDICKTKNKILALSIDNHPDNTHEPMHRFLQKVKSLNIKTIIRLKYTPFTVMHSRLHAIVTDILKTDTNKIIVQNEKYVLLRAEDLNHYHHNQGKNKLKTLPLHDFFLISAPDDFHHLEGKSLKQIRMSLNLSEAEMLRCLLKEFENKGVFAVLNNAHISEFFREHKNALPSTNETYPLFTIPKLPVLTETYTSFLKHFSKNAHPSPSAVHSYTGRLADFFNLKERGYIKPGYIADICVIKDKKVIQTFTNGGELGRFIQVK